MKKMSVSMDICIFKQTVLFTTFKIYNWFLQGMRSLKLKFSRPKGKIDAHKNEDWRI